MKRDKSVRLTISLPESTLSLLDEVAEKSGRSKLIAEAVTRFVTDWKREALARRLKEAYLATAERDRQIAEEWFGVEQEANDRYVLASEEGAHVGEARDPAR